MNRLTERQQDLVRFAMMYHGMFRQELYNANANGESDYGWKYFEMRRDQMLTELGMSYALPDEEAA